MLLVFLLSASTRLTFTPTKLFDRCRRRGILAERPPSTVRRTISPSSSSRVQPGTHLLPTDSPRPYPYSPSSPTPLVVPTRPLIRSLHLPLPTSLPFLSFTSSALFNLRLPTPTPPPSYLPNAHSGTPASCRGCAEIMMGSKQRNDAFLHPLFCRCLTLSRVARVVRARESRPKAALCLLVERKRQQRRDNFRKEKSDWTSSACLAHFLLLSCRCTVSVRLRRSTSVGTTHLFHFAPLLPSPCGFPPLLPFSLLPLHSYHLRPSVSSSTQTSHCSHCHHASLPCPLDDPRPPRAPQDLPPRRPLPLEHRHRLASRHRHPLCLSLRPLRRSYCRCGSPPSSLHLPQSGDGSGVAARTPSPLPLL